MRKETSCGVIFLNASQEVLLCHATGTRRWDLPKGVAEPGEAARSTAVREVWEETSLDIDAQSLLDLGLFDYLPHKRLHLFGLRLAPDALDIAACRCHSTFAHRITGQDVPEIDGYAWKPMGRLDEWCSRNLARVLGCIDWPRFQTFPEAPSIKVKT